MNELQIIEYKSERILTTQQLADSYETDKQVITNNFNRNKDRYAEGKHYYCLKGEELRDFGAINQFDFLPSNINTLYLWTEKGALLHAKSLNTDMAWEVYDQLVETYFKARGMQANLQHLSPQLQLLINLETTQKEMQAQIQATNDKVDGIRDIVALSPTQWRKDTGNMINKMALKLGGYEHIKAIRDESYRLLEQRFGVALNVRLANKKKTLTYNGVCKSKVDKINQLDVIADDKKLIEGYTAIIKELAIKYSIDIGA